MSLRRLVAALLALLVLVTSSRAATICVERDGSETLEFVGSTCCAGPADLGSPGATIGSTQCAGCDDIPLRLVTARLATSAFTSTSLVWAPTSLLAAAFERLGTAFRAPAADDDGQRPPRAAAPARLRC